MRVERPRYVKVYKSSEDGSLWYHQLNAQEAHPFNPDETVFYLEKDVDALMAGIDIVIENKVKFLEESAEKWKKEFAEKADEKLREKEEFLVEMLQIATKKFVEQELCGELTDANKEAINFLISESLAHVEDKLKKKEDKKEEELPPWAANETIDPVELAKIELQCAVKSEDALGIAEATANLATAKMAKLLETEKKPYNGDKPKREAKMIEDKEKYRNECAKRSNKILELQGKKDFIDKLVDEFGDASITDISLSIDEDLEKAQKAYDDFTKEETETLKKIEEKYDSGKILDLIADGYDQIDMVNAYLRGDL